MKDRSSIEHLRQTSNNRGDPLPITVNVRPEKPSDYSGVEELTREAFWNQYAPGCSGHYLLHIMRDSSSFIRELDVVAEVDGKVVGNIVYTKAKIFGDDGNCHEVICFGPISVHPDFQRQGIGSLLIEHTKKQAQEMGFRAILIYGDPDYYRRFGFVPAERYGIGTPDNMYADPLQALELSEGALANCPGRFQEDSVFEIDEAAVSEFDKNFSPKDKRTDLPSQERFRQLVGLRRPR